MSCDVVCLRPEADFLKVGVTPPEGLAVAYRAPDAEDVPALVASARAVLIPAVGPALAASLFEAGSVRLVQVTGAGVDRLDRAGMEALGIAVANVPGGSNDALAEYAIATSLVLLRRFAQSTRALREGRYAAHRAELVTALPRGLGELTVGVVGLGTIGLDVARGFHRMGARILYFDPAPRDPDGAAAIGAESTDLATLLRSADVVTLHVPLLPATRGLIGADELASMKPDAVLIQASRGGIVDEDALAAALSAGAIAGAAVDVYAEEPPAAGHPLFALDGDAADRLILTPHIGGVTRQAWASLFRTAWDNVQRAVEGGAIRHRVY
ncbi:phosphoglycerate dehydrogenase-like enzyme [Amorphus suaedae]